MKPKGSRAEFSRLIKGSLTALGFTSVDLRSSAVDALGAVAEKYLTTYFMRSEARTRGFVLNELNELIHSANDKLGRRIDSRSRDAISILFGVAPANVYNLDNLSPEQIERCVSLQEVVKPFQSDFMRKFWGPQIQPGPLFMTPSGSGDDEGEKAAKRILKEAAAAVPETFRMYVKWSEELLCFSFSSAPLNRPTIETLIAGPDWQLIADVVDVVLPVPMGWDAYTSRQGVKVPSSRRKDVRNVIEATKIYALGYEGVENEKQKDKGQKYIVNDDRVSDVLTLRHQIYTLEKSIKYIESELAAVEEPEKGGRKRKQKGAGSHRENNKRDASSLQALRLWRKELQRRLRVGDYLHRKQGKGLFQALGDARDIPNMPQLGRGRDDDDTLRIHTERLVDLARPLCVSQRGDLAAN